MTSMEMYDQAGRPQPTEIRLKKAEKVLEIDFEDGRSFVFPAEFLRVESPSAEVRGPVSYTHLTLPTKASG